GPAKLTLPTEQNIPMAELVPDKEKKKKEKTDSDRDKEREPLSIYDPSMRRQKYRESQAVEQFGTIGKGIGTAFGGPAGGDIGEKVGEKAGQALMATSKMVAAG